MVEQIKMLKTIVFSKNEIVPMSTDSKALWKWRHLEMILSCGRDQYGHLDTHNIKICPLF